MPTALEARKLSKRFLLRHNPSGDLKARTLGLLHPSRRQRTEEFWALRDLTLRVARGDALGLIGRNGSGKSTLLKIIAAIHRPTSGQLLVARGARIGSMIELGIGFHGELTGEENVYMNTAINGMSRQDAAAIYDAVVAYSGLERFMDVPLKNYSSGMHMRLGFAIAAQLDPDILLLDEIFAVGDEDFQARCMQTLRAFQERGRTIVFVSHSALAVQAICRRAVLLDQGRLVYDGDVTGALNDYRRLTESTPNQPLGTAPSPLPDHRDPNADWHRLATGGLWDEEGAWIADFLRRLGLAPDRFVLEVGCGSLAAATRLLPIMSQSRYWGFDISRELFLAGVQIELPRAGVHPEHGHFVVNDRFDLSECPHEFTLAISSSFLRRLTLNQIAHAFASVVRKLAPGGRFFVTWPDNPDPKNFNPVDRPDGNPTSNDREPYHYNFDVLRVVAESVGARVERLDDSSHPRGESVMVLTPARSA